MKQVRYGHQGSRPPHQFRSIALRRNQLIQSIDRHELNAGGEIDLFFWNSFETPLHHSAGSSVPIMIRILQQFAAFPEQGIIPPPAISPDSFQLRAFELAKSFANLQPEPCNIPMERAAILNRFIGEAVDFLGCDYSGVEMRQNRPPALGAKIECQKCPHARSPRHTT